MTSMPITGIVNVSVSVTAAQTVPSQLNIGLIVGNSNQVQSISAANRATQYASTAAMITAGWLGTEAEYLAAQTYFSQSPKPTAVIIGRQINMSPTLSAAIASGATVTSLAVTALPGDIPSGFSITIGSQTFTTSAYTAANATSISVNSTTASAAYAIGTTVTITETMTAAVTGCRVANANWYSVYTVSTTASDITSIAAYIQSASPNSAFFYDTHDTAVTSGTAGNVMATCQTNKYSRTFGVWSTSNYAGSAAMGVAMGNNTGLANSAFTMAYKSLSGISSESLTNAQVNTITGYNGNVYTAYGNSYNILSGGLMADGSYFDNILNQDIMTLAIQTASMNVLTSNPKVPYTDAGVNTFVTAISAACNGFLTAGYIAPGVWTGNNILNLKTGDTLSNGYAVLADKVANQTSANRSARTFPAIYVALKLAGAIEHLTIAVNVTY